MRVFFGKSCFALLAIFLGLTAASAQQQVVDVNSTNIQGQSLGDLARKVRKDHTDEVQMSDEDTKKLFSSVDEILTFAAEDTGFPQKAGVKRRLVSSADVEKYTREQEAKQGFAKRFTRSELTMKKFGLLPKDFDLREFLVKANGKQIAAYYDFETKTISMLNWIPLDKQKPILAHELTHALQDQNYNLKTWMQLEEKDEDPAAEATTKQDDDGVSTVRRAVVEGQAQVVYLDYVLAPFGRTVQNTPGLIYQMEEPAVQAVADSELLHNAPMIVRELGTFPYKEGLIFEGELLQKGGKAMAFAGAFTHPPRTTHEVLQPKAYLEHESLPSVTLPDLRSIVGTKYAVYDSGSVGELDLRALFKQYGERRAADDLAAAWQGGRYVAFRKTGDASAAPAVADLALVYVSRWKSAQAAGRFAKIYADAVAQRYQSATPDAVPACAGNQCPVASGQFSTETGPVIIEQWADNTVLVSESFDSAMAARLLNAVRDGTSDTRADNFQTDELGLRLMEAPGFSAFQDSLGDDVRDQLATAVNP
jgi:hypothetical protein